MDNLGGILLFILIVFFLILVGAFASDCQSKNDYAYIDMDGKTGFADYCSRDMGQLSCNAGDKTIQVKEFTKIKEEDK